MQATWDTFNSGLQAQARAQKQQPAILPFLYGPCI